VQTSTPRRPVYTGFLRGFLRDSTNAETLLQHWHGLRNLKCLHHDPAQLDAVLEGHCALLNSALYRAEMLRELGQLLFAHADTTYFRHCPAVDAFGVQTPPAAGVREGAPA